MTEARHLAPSTKRLSAGRLPNGCVLEDGANAPERASRGYMRATRISAIATVAPQGDAVTDYDKAQVKLYMRLLDAEASGANLSEIAQVLFGIDEPDRARDAVESHLARARWMTEVGYRLLLSERKSDDSK
jgi:Uncharacterized conserved protein (DUF2285)